VGGAAGKRIAGTSGRPESMLGDVHRAWQTCANLYRKFPYETSRNLRSCVLETSGNAYRKIRSYGLFSPMFRRRHPTCFQVSSFGMFATDAF
jgi:hypothetical protein